jgi:DNA-binding transcriptional regulator YhcF (GntR family)
MPSKNKDDDHDPLGDELKRLAELQEKRHQASIAALNFFVSKYSPATMQDADTFFTTSEISQAIAAHTGAGLENAEIHELMTNMNYSYEVLNGLEFNWLLKK